MANRSTPSPAMVVALIALFVALGGTATALNGSNTVFSDDIVAKNVKQGDINTGAVANGKLAANAVGPTKVLDNSLTGADIADTGSLGTSEIDESTLFNDNSLTGADVADTSSIGTLEINEGSLSTVPNATSASTAAGLSSHTAGSVYGADTFNFDAATSAINTVVASFDGLVLIADCDAGADVQLFATPSANNSYLNSTTITTGAVADSVVDTSFDAQTADLLPVGDGSGTIVFRNTDDVTETPSNNVTTVVFAFEENPPDGTAGACQLMGTVFGGPDF